MSDILLHHSREHQQAKKIRKSLKPITNAVATGVQAAARLLKQTTPSKDATRT